MFKRLIRSPAARRRTSLIVAAVLFLPFILFFHASHAPGPGGAAGKLFGRPVAWDDFQQHRRWMWLQTQQQLQQLPAGLLDAWLAQQTWDRLLLIQEAKRRTVRVPDAEVAREIRQIPALQAGGRFQPDRYQRYVAFLDMSPSRFEAMVRDSLAIRKLVESIRNGIALTDEELRTALRERQERLQARAFLFDAAQHRDAAAAAVTDEAVRARYDAHPDEVRIPEQLAIEYVGVERAELTPTIQPTEQELRAYYAAHDDQFLAEDKTPKPFEAVTEEVRGRFVDDRVRQRLNAAAVELEDAAKQGWRLDEIAAVRQMTIHAAGPMPADAPTGQAPWPIVQALAKLRTGELSGLIETGGGVYAGRATERRPAQVPPLEAVRDRIRERLIAERAREEARQAAQAFRGRLAERAKAGWRLEEALLLESAAATPVEFTRTQTIDPLGLYAPEATRAAFAAPLGTATEAVPVDTGALVLVPEARIAPDEAAITQAMDGARADELARKQQDALERWLADVRGRAQIERFVDRPEGQT